MALWHWIAGGAAAYYLLGKKDEATTIVNHMNQALGVAGTTVQLSGGYNAKLPDGTVTPNYPSLAELLAYVQTTYPVAAVPVTAPVVGPAPAPAPAVSVPLTGYGRW